MLKNKFLLTTLAAVILTACSTSGTHQARNENVAISSPQPMPSPKASERLGTQWGDEVISRVYQVDLRRTTKEPLTKSQVFYANKNYQGKPINSIALLAGKIEFSVETDNKKLPLYRSYGQYYLKGLVGQPYHLIYKNNTANTYEIVASVDGIDVISGKQGSRYSGGYVLGANKTLKIEGFRKSNKAVASFIFSKPDDAYAANTMQAKLANNVGVIGTVVYSLYDPNKKSPKKSPKNKLQPFPADNTNNDNNKENSGYAQPPQ